MSPRLPIFFEAMDEDAGSALQIVRALRGRLYRDGFSPLPFASNYRDLCEVLGALKSSGRAPAIFIINTHGAERLLPVFDELMGETPVLFFRRELMWLRDHEHESGAPGVTAAIGEMRARLTIIRHYGPKNCETVARSMTRKIERFLRFGDFGCLENSLRLERAYPR